MIELLGVEVKNFRSFGEASFTPLRLEEGMTAVNGPNGAGKSSLATHAVLWALYGQTPEGVSVRALRRQGSENEVEVKVTFLHNGQTVIVSRGLKGKNDTTVASISVDGVEQTNVSSKTATSWVVERLGIDAEAFTTAFVIRQKEVDALVRARPAERRALIERLAGIDKMSEALKKAREDAREAKIHVASYGEIEDVEKLTVELQGIEEKFVEKKTEHGQLLEAKTSAETKVGEHERAFKYSIERKDVYDKLDHAWELQHQETMNREKQYREKVELAKDADLLPDIEAQIEELEGKKNETEELHREAKEYQRILGEKQARYATLLEEVKENQGMQGALQMRLETLQDKLDSYDKDMEEKLAESRRYREEAVSGLGAAVAEQTRVQRVLGILQETTGDPSCPTCSRPMDDPQELVMELSEQVRFLGERVEKLTREKGEAEQQVEAWEQAIVDRESTERDVEGAKTRLSELSDQELKLVAGKEKLEDEISECEEKLTTVRNQVRATVELFPNLPEQLSELRSSFRKAENAVEAEQMLPGLKHLWEEALKAEEALKTQLGEYEVRVLESDISRTEQELEKIRAMFMRVFEQVNAKEKEVLMLGKEVEEYQRLIQAAEQDKIRRRQAVQNAEQANMVASALEEFRKDRIARLAPELSEVASDIVSVMTEGRYSTVELDEDFTPILTETATGSERPVSWLSGGEESAVALALRIAVGEVVSGQHAGMLVLDEVLTAQDKSRRASVMAAIRELKSRQIITINHVSEATDMVDAVVNVVPSPDGEGYTVETAVSEDTVAVLGDENTIDMV